MNRNLRVIFLGTPDFAAAGLRKLIENNVRVVAVITAPDKPKGRGKKVGISAVKVYAEAVHLPILQPPNLKSPEFLDKLKSFKADLQVVVAFRMLPEVVWNMPPLGTFNLHASLLPQYRGAAPIHRAIINGEKETGITTFFLKHEIDTGVIIYQEKEPILEDDTMGSLYTRLMNKGADLVLKTVRSIETGDYPQLPQKVSKNLKSAPKIFKADCKIDWDQSTLTIQNFIRGLSPYPAAWCVLEGKTMKIFKSSPVAQSDVVEKPGTFVSDNKNYIKVSTRDGYLNLDEIQQEGKKRMEVKEFLRGYRFYQA